MAAEDEFGPPGDLSGFQSATQFGTEADLVGDLSGYQSPTQFGTEADLVRGPWDWLPSKEQFGTFSKDLKAGLSDVTKLDKDSQQQQQRQSSAQGGGISAAQAVRGQAPVSIEDLLNELMQRRAAYAKLGLQPGPFQPRAPGGGLLAIAG